MSIRRTTLVLFALFALLLSPAALAEDAAPVADQNTTAESPMDSPTGDTAPTLDALFSLNPMNHTQAATSSYCTRAIDIEGAFCYIGCPEGCNCDVETFFSECCCNVN